ncbi:von Willebrand factor type A domain-containing protein [Immersiella caudata]|uniref:von Willebrand factor type A domain-containing protein n=1 Tax=Immersiella caudata TaxID=314043 RepID=A0AA39X6A2_9PEZI|nr:von Willebrand factor type A domain-containing protein [Immersiella caudata]
MPPNNDRPVFDDGFFPPVAVSIHASITHDTAKVTINQLFTNNTGSLIPRAGYTFPLPPGSTVDEFSCRIGRDKILKGKVKPKSDARDTFEEGVAQNRSAGLLQQNSSELFTTTLGNLQPDVQMKVTLSFIIILDSALSVESGKTRLTFKLPTYVAPRYGTPPGGVDRLLSRSATATSLSVSVDILAATRILSTTSPNFPETNIELGTTTRQQWVDFAARRSTMDVRCATARLETAFLDRDFVLQIFRVDESPALPFACLETHPEFPDQSALMLTIPPNVILGSGGEYDGGEIIFVADRSGSMSDKIQALKSAMKFFLGGLPVNCNFNIWSFGSDFCSLWPRSRPYNSSSRRDAESHIACDFKADLGGTELLSALKGVAASRGGFATTDIIVLTDGQVWDPENTIEFVKQTRHQSEGRVRFFSLGIGNAVSHELVEGIAKAGGGYAEVIQTASQGGWEGSLVALLKAAAEKHVFPASISIKWGRADEEVLLEDYSPAEVSESPHDISKLSPFMMNRLLYLLKHDEYATPRAIDIHYAQPGVPENYLRVPISVLQTPDTTIHKFAARALLGDLERGESRLHVQFGAARAMPELSNQVRLQGEALGCKWSLVSKWTSFVAVEVPVPDHELYGAAVALVDKGDGSVCEQGRGLNLLRRQGDPYVTVEALGAIEPMEIASNRSESDGEDSELCSSQGDDEMRDNDSDNDHDDAPGHGGGGSAGASGPRGGARGGGDYGDSADGGNGHSSEELTERTADPPQASGADNKTRGVVHAIRIHTAAPNIKTRHFTTSMSAPRAISPSTHSYRRSRSLKTRHDDSDYEFGRKKKKRLGSVRTEMYGPVNHHVPEFDMHSKLFEGSSSSRASGRTSILSSPAPEPPTTSSITAPQNNLPASTAIQFSEPSLTTDPVENWKRELVGLLLTHQDPSGKFLSVNESSGTTIGNILGTDFEKFVDMFTSYTSSLHSGDDPQELPKSYFDMCMFYGSSLHSVADQHALPTSNFGDIARTAAILQFLRIHLQACRDLWQLMDPKAIAYLHKACPAASVDVAVVMSFASMNGVAGAHFCVNLTKGVGQKCTVCIQGPFIRIPLQQETQDVSISRFAIPTLSHAAALPISGPGKTPLTDFDFSSFLSPSWGFEFPTDFSFGDLETGLQDSETAANDGDIALVGLETSDQAEVTPDKAEVSSGGIKGRACGPALYAAGEREKSLKAPMAVSTGAKDVYKGEQADLVQRLAVEREAKSVLSSGREVEIPDEI